MKYFLFLCWLPLAVCAQSKQPFRSTVWYANDHITPSDSAHAAYRLTMVHMPDTYTRIRIAHVPSEQPYIHYDLNWRSDTGTLTSWYPDGRLHERRIWKAGAFLYMQAWDSSGNQVVKDGNGLYRSWYPGGGKETEFTVAAGNIHGTFRRWHPNHVLAAEYRYQQGTPHGESQEWDSAGKPFAPMVYDAGSLVSGNHPADSADSGIWEMLHTNQYYLMQIAPRPVNMKEVKMTVGYPQAARDAGIQGEVILQVLFDESGTYVEHKLIQSVHPATLDPTCEAHIVNLKFTPALQNGVPVKCWITIPFRFQIEKSHAKKNIYTVRGEDMNKENIIPTLIGWITGALGPRMAP